jgi:hypothetical protein
VFRTKKGNHNKHPTVQSNVAELLSWLQLHCHAAKKPAQLGRFETAHIDAIMCTTLLGLVFDSNCDLVASNHLLKV